MQKLNNTLNKYNILKSLSEKNSLDSEIISFIDGQIKLLNNNIESSQNEDFNITIVAPMKAGKSSFINALIREDLMPNESEACTFFPIELKLNSSEENIYKVYNDGRKELAGGKNYYKRIHDDIRKIRSGQINAGDLYKYEIGLNLESINLSDNFKINLIDLPGINEAKDENNGNIEKMFLDVIEKSNQVIYLFDIQYYKSSENVDILNKIKLCRPDLIDNMLFVLTKIDLFDFNKGKSIEDTKDDIKNILKQININNAEIIECSSKLELLAAEIDKGAANDENNILYKFLSSFSIELIRNIGKRISKSEKVIEKNYDYISKNIKLDTVEKDGKTMFVLPESQEISNEIKLKSNFNKIKDNIQHMVDNVDDIKKNQSRNILGLCDTNFEEVTNTIIEESKLKRDELLSDPQLQEIDSLEKSISKINKVKKFSSKSKVDYNKIKDILEDSVSHERKNMKVTSYYDTEWYQYSRDVCSINETTPGGYKENLEVEAAGKYRNLVNALDNNTSKLINTYKKDILADAKKYTDGINDKLKDIYKSMNTAFNSGVMLNINENKLYSIEIPRKFYESVQYESKGVSKEVGLFKKRTEYYWKYRLRNVYDFKQGCLYAADKAIETTAKNIAEKLNKELIEIVNENIQHQLKNHIKTLRYVIDDKRKKSEHIYDKIDSLNMLMLDIDKCREDVMINNSTNNHYLSEENNESVKRKV